MPFREAPDFGKLLPQKKDRLISIGELKPAGTQVGCAGDNIHRERHGFDCQVECARHVSRNRENRSDAANEIPRKSRIGMQKQHDLPPCDLRSNIHLLSAPSGAR